MQKRALVCGAGGFIGGHLAIRLRQEGYFVRGVDLKHNEYHSSEFCNEFIIGDLRNIDLVRQVLDESIDEVYQLAALMGGSGFVFTGDNDADIMHSSALINLNVAEVAIHCKTKKLFYSSSACMYPEYNQLEPDNPNCEESSAYPANPDSEYGWEKLFSERLFLAFARNKGLNVRIARFHNIFGPKGTWNGGLEKAPAALCRKIASLGELETEIEIWGDGKQTRSFLHVSECVEGIRRLMESDFVGPVNIGSDEMVSINDFVTMISEISGKKVTIKHIPGPQGVRGRNSDNRLIFEKLGWKPSHTLRQGMVDTYSWIKEQVDKLNKQTGMN